MTKEQAQQIIEAILTLRNNATDEVALSAPAIYPAWRENINYPIDYRVLYENTLYKCLQAHTSQSSWTPTDAPSLWTKVLAGQDGTEIGEWEQPDSTNPYKKGDKVTFQGKAYESTIDGNVWSPSAYPDGWKEI